MYISKDRYEELKRELERLESKGRKEIAKRLKEAKQLGDLSENSEYQEARNSQAWLEQKIEHLTEVLRQAEIIRKSAHKETVSMGSQVVLRKNGDEKTYTIVGSDEADPRKGSISNESSLGKLLIGKRVGDEVKLKTPKGEVHYSIIDIS